MLANWLTAIFWFLAAVLLGIAVRLVIKRVKAAGEMEENPEANGGKHLADDLDDEDEEGEAGDDEP